MAISTAVGKSVRTNGKPVVSNVAAVAYMRRVAELYEKANQLVEFGNSLEKQLKSKANQSESFTFFFFAGNLL